MENLIAGFTFTGPIATKVWPQFGWNHTVLQVCAVFKLTSDLLLVNGHTSKKFPLTWFSRKTGGLLFTSTTSIITVQLVLNPRNGIYNDLEAIHLHAVHKLILQVQFKTLATKCRSYTWTPTQLVMTSHPSIFIVLLLHPHRSHRTVYYTLLGVNTKLSIMHYSKEYALYKKKNAPTAGSRQFKGLVAWELTRSLQNSKCI